MNLTVTFLLPLVLTGIITHNEAEKIQRELYGESIPISVKELQIQIEHILERDL